jgi:hypothetical protein
MGAHTPACLCAASDPVETVTPPNYRAFVTNAPGASTGQLARAAFLLYRDPGIPEGPSPPPISRRKYLVFFSLERAFPTKYFLQKDLLTEILRSITYGDPRAPLAEIMKKLPLKISQVHSFTERFSSSPVCRSGDCCWDTRISLCAGWVELPANAKAVADARFPPVLS